LIARQKFRYLVVLTQKFLTQVATSIIADWYLYSARTEVQ